MAGVAHDAAPRASRMARLRALLWLRWTLQVRRFTQSWQQALNLVVLLIVVGGFGTLLSVASAFAYVQAPRETATQVLFLVLAGLYILWAVLPLMQYTLNEGLDVSKLQTFPVTRFEQAASMVLATVFDVPSLAMLAFSAAILVGWHATPLATVLTCLALVVAYVHTIALSQLLLAGLQNVLRSRRYRDLSIILFALLGVAFAFSGQVLPRVLNAAFPRRGLPAPALHVDAVLQWLPPGMAGRAIVLADAGQFAQASLWLAGSAMLVPLVLWLWLRLLERSVTTAETAGGARRAHRTTVEARQHVGALALWRRLVPAPVRAVAGKDLRYFWRDPQLKAVFFSSLSTLIFVLLPQIASRPNGAVRSLASTQVFAAVLPSLFVALSFSMNALGLERQALQSLFLFPVRPLHVFWGKNLAVATVAGSVLLITTTALAALSHGWENLPLALVLGAAGLLVILGVGNATSVLLPFRMREMRAGTGTAANQEGGCLRGLLSMAALLLTTVLLAPVALALVLPLALGHREWLVGAVPLALLYALGLHQLASHLVAPRLALRVPEILRATVGGSA